MSESQQKPQEVKEIKEVKGAGRLFKRLFLSSKLDDNLINEVLSGNTEGVKNAILQGANINARDALGTSALMLACDLNYFDLVSLFISKNANLDLSNQFGLTALHYAVQRRDIRVVRILLNSNDDGIEKRVNKKDEKGNTPLHYAVESGNLDIVDFLLKRKANKFIENKEKQIPMDIARKKQFAEMVTVLKQKLG